LPSTPHDYQAIEQVLAQPDLQTLHHHLITELSGSGQRRVILVRALAQQPQLLLLDTPDCSCLRLPAKATQ
jgi:ABC-type cobalamin/Fe3+-siderophores transport system ATPase subunit